MHQEQLRQKLPNEIHISYPVEILQLTDSLGLKTESYLGGGTINHGWAVTDVQRTKNSILVVGPPVGTTNLESQTDAGYLDPCKFTKAKKITDMLTEINMPVAKFESAGTLTVGSNKMAWGVQEKADGVCLSNLWKNLASENQLKLATEIGEIMGTYQHINDIENLDNPTTSAAQWYMDRVIRILNDGETLKIFNGADKNRITDTFIILLDLCKPNDYMGLIHGDLFQANIFVDQENNDWKIKKIIDWETAIIGHVGYEQVLSAWWVAGEKNGKKDLFEKLIFSSTEAGIGIGFPPENLGYAISLVDMLWHINVIVSCSAMNKKSNIPKWQNTLEKMLTCIESGNIPEHFMKTND